jgi:4a-hydroxytetrahydrobiopterin dehydratase
MRTLTPAQRHEALAQLPGWTEVPGRDAIGKTFRFGNFARAFAFMTDVARVAETMDHHPEWTNVYDRVEVVLTTHDAQGVTEKDIELARAIEKAAGGALERD